MYKLPVSTELQHRIQLSKERTISFFKLSGKERERFDNNIHKVIITHEISPKTVNIPAGKKISAIYLIEIFLKDDFFDTKIIDVLERMKQTAIYLLRYEYKCKIVLFERIPFESDWVSEYEIRLNLKGFNLDEVWDNLLRYIGKMDDAFPVEEQIDILIHNSKIQKQIETLKSQMAKEKQMHKISEYYDEIQRLKEDLR